MIRVGLLLLAALGVTKAAEQNLLPLVSGEVLHANTVEFGLLSFRDVVTRPELHGRQLVFDRCQGKTYGGMVYGSLTVDLPPADHPDAPTMYRGRFELAKADLATVLRQLSGNQQNLSGEVSGWLEFSLLSDRPEQMSGRGELTIHKASLVQLPVLANLLVGDPAGAKGQDQLDTRFEIGEGKLNLVFARLDSPAAQISITGHIDFSGDLRLGIEPAFTNKVADAVTGGVATFLLNPLTRRAARFAVRGQITHPVLVSDPFGSKD